MQAENVLGEESRRQPGLIEAPLVPGFGHVAEDTFDSVKTAGETQVLPHKTSGATTHLGNIHFASQQLAHCAGQRARRAVNFEGMQIVNQAFSHPGIAGDYRHEPAGGSLDGREAEGLAGPCRK
jgi:hypothetical protein